MEEKNLIKVVYGDAIECPYCGRFVKFAEADDHENSVFCFCNEEFAIELIEDIDI